MKKSFLLCAVGIISCSTHNLIQNEHFSIDCIREGTLYLGEESFHLRTDTCNIVKSATWHVDSIEFENMTGGKRPSYIDIKKNW